MSWLHYLVEANIYLSVFYLCYCLFLTRDTHYALGRFYLLFSCVFAFILPFTQISILKPIEPVVQEIQIQPLTTSNTALSFGLQDALFYAYLAGGIITFIVLIHRFYRLFRLSQGRDKECISNYKLIRLAEDNTAFSFFNNLYIGNGLSQSSTVIAHELVHIRQKHSWDIVFIELLKIVSWFNPFIYLLQNSLKTVHEYIADEQTAAKEQDTLTYSSFLLSNAYGIQGSSIAHSFFNYNLLKKRIIMLNQKRSGRLARLKYLAVIPLCGGMLCTSTLVFSKNYGFIDLAPKHNPAAVINAPHIAMLNTTADTIKKKTVKHSRKVKTKVNPDIAEIEIEPPLVPFKTIADVKEVRINAPVVKRSKKLKKGEKLYTISDVKEIEIETPPPPPPPAAPADAIGVKPAPSPAPATAPAQVTKIRISPPPPPPAVPRNIRIKKTDNVVLKLAVPKVEKDSLKATN
jgi:hypothetical protein